MSTRVSNRVGQRPDHSNPVLQRQESSGKRGLFAGNCRFRLVSPARLVRRFGRKMVIALRVKRKTSREVVPKACVVAPPPPDPHRSEAIEDCIHFLNSSSTKQHSVPATTIS